MLKKGITRRWVFNGFGIVLIMLVLLEIVSIVAVRYYSYNQVEDVLRTRADALGGQLERLAEDSNFSMEVSSRTFVENFVEKNTMELQMVRSDGTVLYTSSGFSPEVKRIHTSSDYRQAISDEDGEGTYYGHTSSGEPIMALCTAVFADNHVVGLVRCVVSLTEVNRQITGVALLLVGVGLLVLFFVALSGSYFIGSIINPIKEVGRATRRIAMGDYHYRLKRRYDDEIGDLCDAINYMTGEIENAEKVKNEFISSVSHELRTPLTAIKGWSETMAQGMDDPELMRTGLSIITGETERLCGIVEELLDFSRMQNDNITLTLQSMHLDEALSEVVLLLRERAINEGLTMHYVATKQLPPIVADPDRLKQVFINVIDNAIKYSGRGGTIRIEAADMGRKVQVVISDSGVGISREDLAKVKTKFYRANHTRPGSGIGLALADEIMRRHHGRMDIDSKLGVGTTVTLTIPVRKDTNKV